MSEPMPRVFVLESRGGPLDSKCASVGGSPREIQPLEFAPISQIFKNWISHLSTEGIVEMSSESPSRVPSTQTFFLSCRLRVSAFVDVDLRVTCSIFFVFSVSLT